MPFPSMELAEASVKFRVKYQHSYSICEILKEDERMRNVNQYGKDTEDAMDWSAFIAGGLIGAGIALLFTPQRGTELRSKLRDYADRAKDELMEQGREVWDTAVKRGKEYYDNEEKVVRDAGRSQGNLPNRDSRRGGHSIKEFALRTLEVASDQRRSAL